MKRIFIKVLIALCFLAVLIPLSIIEYVSLVEDGVIMSSDNRAFQEKLKQKLESGAEEIRIKDLTNFGWDEACMYVDFDYKTGIIDDGHPTWFIDFFYNGIETKEFRIQKSLVGLKNADNTTFSYCYSNQEELKIGRLHDKLMIILNKR